MSIRIRAEARRWPLRRPFAIARGVRENAETLLVTLTDEAGRRGRGEAVPYPRHGESMEAALAEVARLGPRLPDDLTPPEVTRLSGMKAVRNALDCALWELRARQAGVPVWRLAGLAPPRAVVTACTISLGPPAAMAGEAASRREMPLLKVKLGGAAAEDMERLAAVRAAAPRARLIVDANEGWRAADLPALLAACAAAGVEMVEQPLPAGADAALASIPRTAETPAICADESVHVAADLPALAGRYDAVNVKLDKAGGLTPAMELAKAAQAAGMAVMVGCMLASSLAMAPAMLLAGAARWVDLDGPLLLAEDMRPPIAFDGAVMRPPDPELWG